MMEVRVRDSLSNQKGAAMLIFLATIMLGTTAYLVADFNALKSQSDKTQRTLEALNEAKLAVIGWSLRQSIPGRLPCPEDLTLIGTANEGNSKTSCNEAIPIGRLPWKTLALGDLRDSNGDKLWYAISSGFRNAPINHNTTANLKINHQANAAVAIIFSSGKPLAQQKRINHTDITQYLELSNVNGSPTFTSGHVSKDFNDLLAIISKDDLFNAVNMRILGEIRGKVGLGGMADFYSKYGSYPYADIQGYGQSDDMSLNGSPSYEGVIGRDLAFVSDIKTMLKNNAWPSLIQYQVNPERTEVTLKLGNQSIQVRPIP